MIRFEDLPEHITDGIREEIVDQAASQLVESLKTTMTRKLEERVVKEVEERLPAVFDVVLNTELQMRDDWGDPDGKPVSLRDKIKERAEKYLTEKVDKRGERTYSANQTRLDYVARKAAEDAVNCKLQKELEKVCDAAKEQVLARCGKIIAERLLK